MTTPPCRRNHGDARKRGTQKWVCLCVLYPVSLYAARTNFFTDQISVLGFIFSCLHSSTGRVTTKSKSGSARSEKSLQIHLTETTWHKEIITHTDTSQILHSRWHLPYLVAGRPLEDPLLASDGKTPSASGTTRGTSLRTRTKTRNPRLGGQARVQNGPSAKRP